MQLVAGPEDEGKRLDKWLADKLTDISRSRLQALIREGSVRRVEGDRHLPPVTEPKTPVKAGEEYALAVPAAAEPEAKGEQIPLSVVYEDNDLIVIDKPAGLVVHPAAGHSSGTLVNALIAHCGDSLSGIGGVKRPGIVHRIDKDTSGLLVVAKNDAAHEGLSDQFKSHGLDGRLERTYLAFVWGRMERPKGRIDLPLERSTKNRLKIAVARGNAGRHAVTHYEVVGVYAGEKSQTDISLLRLTLETGRTHQIRVHLTHIGHPLLGDVAYGAGFKTRMTVLQDEVREAAQALGRQALHAESLSFEHPRTSKKLRFKSDLPSDLARLKAALDRTAGKLS